MNEWKMENENKIMNQGMMMISSKREREREIDKVPGINKTTTTTHLQT
jgi:hypothetical protein